jgi:hypothetical protein
MVGFWVIFGVCNIFYAKMSDGSKQDSVVRDGRWDTAKFFFMMCVVWSHILGHWNIQKDYIGFPQEAISRFHMPGFSFVSGLFAASGPVCEWCDGGKVTLHFSKLKGIMRDLILVNWTIKPLVAAFMLFNFGFGCNLPSLTSVGLGWWYLGALAIWQFVTPMLCTLRYPVLIAGTISIIFRAGTEAGCCFYFVFFVLGFVLGGGGRDADERKEMRKNLETWLCSKNSRVAAIFILTTWATVFSSKRLVYAESPGWVRAMALILDPNTDFNREQTPWEEGGYLTDVLRIVFATILLLCFFSIVFMFPACDALSHAGTRTLYAYVLQRDVILGNPSIQFFVIRNVPGSLLPIAAGFVAFTFTLLIGSKLMHKLTHVFVQPQWLIDLITYNPPSKPVPLVPEQSERSGEALLKSVDTKAS